MGQRKVSDDDAKWVILHGETVESHPDAYPFPKALFMAVVREKPLYVSAAFDGQFAYIITVHWFDPDVWIDPGTRRKSQ